MLNISFCIFDIFCSFGFTKRSIGLPPGDQMSPTVENCKHNWALSHHRYDNSQHSTFTRHIWNRLASELHQLKFIF